MGGLLDQAHGFRTPYHDRHGYPRKQHHVPERKNGQFLSHLLHSLSKVFINITICEDRHYDTNIIIQVVVRLLGKHRYFIFLHIFFIIVAEYSFIARNSILHNKRAKVTIFNSIPITFAQNNCQLLCQILFFNSNNLPYVMINVQ